jgi:hypothetical protein
MYRHTARLTTRTPGFAQVLFANFTGVIWNCYVSWKAHSSLAHDDTHAHAQEGGDVETGGAAAAAAAAPITVPVTTTGASDVQKR